LLVPVITCNFVCTAAQTCQYSVAQKVDVTNDGEKRNRTITRMNILLSAKWT